MATAEKAAAAIRRFIVVSALRRRARECAESAASFEANGWVEFSEFRLPSLPAMGGSSEKTQRRQSPVQAAVKSARVTERLPYRAAWKFVLGKNTSRVRLGQTVRSEKSNSGGILRRTLGYTQRAFPTTRLPSFQFNGRGANPERPELTLVFLEKLDP